MAINFDQIIRLQKKTGSKVVFQNGEDFYVLLSADEFEQLVDGQGVVNKVVGLTEDQLVDKINGEIAEWRMNHPDEQANGAYFEEKEAEETSNEDEYYLEPVDENSVI